MVAFARHACSRRDYKCPWLEQDRALSCSCPQVAARAAAAGLKLPEVARYIGVEPNS